MGSIIALKKIYIFWSAYRVLAFTHPPPPHVSLFVSQTIFGILVSVDCTLCSVEGWSTRTSTGAVRSSRECSPASSARRKLNTREISSVIYPRGLRHREQHDLYFLSITIHLFLFYVIEYDRIN